MRCSHCGHENPGEFKFCGMCGNQLPLADVPAGRPVAEREPASTRVPWPPQEITSVSGRGNRYQSERQPQPSESLRAAEEYLRKRPAPAPPPQPEEEEHARFAEPESPRQAEIHGPSFLGLSDSSESTAYLLEDDGGGSSAVRIVFLLILLAAAAVVWWKWEPIKNYVWTQASMHAQEAKPAAAEPQPDASNADSSKPAAQPVPQDDQPEMATETPAKPAPADAKPAVSAGASSAAADKNGDTAAESKPADNSSEAAVDEDGSPEKSASVGKKTGKNESAAKAAASEPKEEKAAAEPKAEDEEAGADETPAPAARKAAPPKPRPDDGADLLSKAENYLYGRGGVPQSCRQALVYFKAAADRQNPAALSHVGAMYATGECGVRVDRVQAYKWFSKAYELQPSNHYLERNLTMLWREMSDQERQAVTRPSTTRGQ